MKMLTTRQLFMMTVIFQVGTSVIFGFASASGRDAWITTLLSTVIGSLPILMFLMLMRLYPGMTIVEWFPKTFGNWLGVPLAWIYPVMFFFGAAHSLGDIKDMLITTILPGTPEWAILALFISVMIYILMSGVQTIGRLTEMILPVLILFFLIEIILILSSEVVDFHRLAPIAGEGWGRIFHVVMPNGISQSFAESIALTMIWPMADRPEKMLNQVLIATFLSGMIIAVFDAIAIAVFGEMGFMTMVYPLYTLTKTISIADFFENLDAIGILYFVCTAFFKTSIQMYALVRSVQQLLYLNSYRSLVIPISLVALIVSLTLSKSSSEHFAVFSNLVAYTGVPFYIVLPFLLLVAAFIKTRLLTKI